MPQAIQENILRWCGREGKVSKPQVSGVMLNAKAALVQMLHVSISNKNSTSPSPPVL